MAPKKTPLWSGKRQSLWQDALQLLSTLGLDLDTFSNFSTHTSGEQKGTRVQSYEKSTSLSTSNQRRKYIQKNTMQVFILVLLCCALCVVVLRVYLLYALFMCFTHSLQAGCPLYCQLLSTEARLNELPPVLTSFSTIWRSRPRLVEFAWGLAPKMLKHDLRN